MHISTTDLFLAYRQAKISLYFERRGVGLVALAKYEDDLAKNLIHLQTRLKGGGWFNGITPGQVWVVPKRRRSAEASPNDVAVIGSKKRSEEQMGLDIHIQMSPSPDFAIVEILYLWQFGSLLDGLLPKEVIGYRLDLRDGEIRKHARWVFEYWPKRYNEFRREGLNAAQRALIESREPVDLLSADLASFYDTVDASFLLTQDFIDQMSRSNAEPRLEDVDAYVTATKSLLAAHAKFHQKVRSCTGLDWSIGVPIGALTSRVIANVALASLDEAILRQPDVLCYRRYVDDFVVVGRSGQADLDTIDAMMSHYVPPSRAVDERFELDVAALRRPGSQFSLQREKCRAHRLEGQAGRDFLNAIAADFRHLVSERRAFMDTSVFDPKEVRRVIRAGKEAGTPVGSLRDADRTKLEHFALSTALSSLERLSMLVDNDDARRLVRSELEGLERLVAEHDGWVESIEPALRLLGIAVSIRDWDTADQLIGRMDSLWGDLDALHKFVASLYYRGTPIERSRAWVWLRNYLHEARLEAICGSIGPIGDENVLSAGMRAGLVYRTDRCSYRVLMQRAKELAAADLRAFDREDDVQVRGAFEVPDGAFRKGLALDDEMRERLETINAFVEKAQNLNDPAWNVDAGRLFVSTRPPSYFDIARRWLYNVERDGFGKGIFEELLGVVNAIRGTAYEHPVGTIVTEDPICVMVPGPAPEGNSITFEPADPRLILGNLAVEEGSFHAAANKTPSETVERLKGLATVLARAASVAHQAPPGQKSLLVLPELSLPRRWFREVANHVVRYGPHGLVVGLEFLHHPSKAHVFNQVYAVFPGPFASVATWPWTKRRPADVEAKELDKHGLSFTPVQNPGKRRAVVNSPYGRLSVLICSELLEARRVADLLRRVELVVVPSWNKDTSSYDHLIQSAGLQLHAIVAIANNGTYSDCRVWAPKSDRWARDLCRLIERQVDDVVYVDIPLSSLRKFHSKLLCLSGANKHASGNKPEWMPLPPDWAEL